MKISYMILSLTLILCFNASAQTQASDEEEIRCAVANFYAANNYKDGDAYLQYMAPGGYTAFLENGSDLFKVNEELIRRSFKEDWVSNLEAIELDVKVYGDAALVTGYRVGTLTVADGETQKTMSCLTMMWIRFEGEWRLVHIHLSPLDMEG